MILKLSTGGKLEWKRKYFLKALTFEQHGTEKLSLAWKHSVLEAIPD